MISSPASDTQNPSLDLNNSNRNSNNTSIPKLHIDSISEELCDLGSITSTERLKRIIRNTSTNGCKYLDVWQRVRMKIKSKLMIKHLSNDLKLYGTSGLA